MRVWDKFLTEQDKALYERSKWNIRPVGFGKKPALLLIDNYIAGLGDEPLPLEESLKKFPYSTGLVGWEAVKHQKRLLKLCREIDIPIIHTSMNVAPNGPRDFISAVRGDPRKRTMGHDAFPDTSVFNFTPDLAPLDNETVILKSQPSVFHGTSLLSVLIRFGVDTLLVCGESTSGCVRASVVDAASNAYRVIVVEECVYDRTEAAHAINLFDINQKYGDVLAIDEVCAWLQTHFNLPKAS